MLHNEYCLEANPLKQAVVKGVKKARNKIQGVPDTELTKELRKLATEVETASPSKAKIVELLTKYCKQQALDLTNMMQVVQNVTLSAEDKEAIFAVWIEIPVKPDSTAQ